MRHWYVIVGVVMAITLPVLVAVNVSAVLVKLPALAGYPVAFGFVTLAGQVGLTIKRLDQRQPAASLVRDVLIAMVAGLVAYWATRLMILRGGGLTDPALLALICAYLLMVWRPPGARRSA